MPTAKTAPPARKRKAARRPAVAGRRTRKKEETRRRIIDAAMMLFAKRGFAATTIEDIAAAADISKRSFFDYFPAKEDVIEGWQDAFKAELVAAVAERPASETLSQAAERSLVACVEQLVVGDSRMHARLRAEVPALAARDQLKFAQLEETFAQALIKRREGKADELRARLVAMVTIGAVRVAGDYFIAQRSAETPVDGVRRILKAVRTEWSTPKTTKRGGKKP